MANAVKIAPNNTTTSVGAWKGYDIQAVSLQPGDVLLAHISSYMDFDDCQQIMKVLEDAFPNNKVLLANEKVLKGLTIIRPGETTKVDDVVNIATSINVDKLFDEIMRGNPNDFLH